MRVLLRNLNCHEAIEEGGTESAPKDAKAMEAIYRHLSSYALNIVREKGTAKEVWDTFKST